MTIKFESRDCSLKEALFSSTRFQVPQFQRPFSWTEDQFNDFWNDVVDGEQGFFIGQFIFNYENVEGDGFVDIIDGQQRITTITIFCAALRDAIREIGDIHSESVIESAIFADKDFDQVQYRFIPSPPMKDFFVSVIQSGDSSIEEEPGETEEELAVAKAYLLFSKKISEHLKDLAKEEKIKLIQNVFEKVRSTRVILTKIFSEEDAYEIFETVNARGVELSVADLLKNTLFRKIRAEGGDIQEVQIKWAEDIKGVIEEADIELTKFIRYFWLSKHSFVSEKKLFREIKHQNFESYTTLLEELCLNADALYTIKTLDHSWGDIENGLKIQKALSGIKVMDITQCYVLLLAIFRNLEKLPISTFRVFETVEKFNFLYHSISRQPANRVEKLYHSYALKLEEILSSEQDEVSRNEVVQHLYDKLVQDLRSLVPTYELFHDGFKTLTYKRRDLIRYILEKFEEARGTEEKIINQSRVNIEHVLPRTPGKGWNLSKKDVRNYVDEIGNLTLLGKKSNSRIGNKSIQEKMEILKDSTDIKLTEELMESIAAADYSWSKKEISNRTSAMAKEAYHSVWRI